MKKCPQCGRDYNDETMSFCLDDGSELLFGPRSLGGPSDDEPATGILSEPRAEATGFPDDEPQTVILSEREVSAGGQFDERQTAILHKTGSPGEAPTRARIQTTGQTAVLQTGVEAEPRESVNDSTEKRRFRHKERASVDETRNSAHSAVKPLMASAAAFLLLAGGFFGYRYFSPTKQINSIAVMPFENRNSDADTDYLSDGLAESLIFRLTQIADLKVSPTSSVMRYKGKETDIVKIASELGVDAVMTGRLTKRGDNLNITVELVDARTNESLWGEQYERKLSELLTTQREIVAEIVGKLQLKLSGENEQKLAKKYTESNEAYQLYLKGRFFWNKRTEDNLNKAIEQFKEAVSKDPNFALAYVGLADCYGVLPDYSNSPPSEFLPQTKAYSEQAIVVDDNLGEAHISLANAYLQLWNWEAAEKEFKRGLELSPNYSTGHQWYAQFLSGIRRYDESLAEYKRAQELEPLSLVITVNLAEAYLIKGEFETAAEMATRAIQMDPHWYVAYQYLALARISLGKTAEGVAAAERAVELSNRARAPLGILGYALGRAGRSEAALKIASELELRFENRQAKGSDVANVYLGSNLIDKAFVWLEKDFEGRDATLGIGIAVPPLFELREDPRYKDLRKRMNIPE